MELKVRANRWQIHRNFAKSKIKTTRAGHNCTSRFTSMAEFETAGSSLREYKQRTKPSRGGCVSRVQRQELAKNHHANQCSCCRTEYFGSTGAHRYVVSILYTYKLMDNTRQVSLRTIFQNSRIGGMGLVSSECYVAWAHLSGKLRGLNTKTKFNGQARS